MDDRTYQGRTDQERAENIDELWLWSCIWAGLSVLCFGGYWLARAAGWWA